MKLHYKGRNRKIKKALQIANEILNNPLFYDQISSIERFDNTIPEDLKPSEIANFLRNHPKKVYVKTFIGRLGVNAKTKRSTYFRLNRLELDRPTTKIVRTMIHEYVHCIDFSLKKYKFTHKDNNNDNGDEDNTAPWTIGRIAYELSSK